MTTTTNPRDYVAPEGRVVIVIGPFCWGKHKHAKQALANCRKNAPRIYHKKPKDTYYFLDAPESAWVNDMGGINRPVDSEEAFEIGKLELRPPY